MITDAIDDLTKEREIYRTRWLVAECEAREKDAALQSLILENWQLKGALGYPVPGHIPPGAFKCGLCEARALTSAQGHHRENER